MFNFFIGYIVGSFITFIGIIGYFGYHYYKAWKEAYDEGWDMPN
jgi:hypothetical protein